MIHAYKMDDMHIVLDVNSGAVHVLDPLTYDLVLFYDEHKTLEGFTNDSNLYTLEELEEAKGELTSLLEEGLLFAEDSYEAQVQGYLNRKPVVKALCLHVAHDCNLKCEYCFAGEGEYHGHRELMSFETGKKALEFVCKNSGSRKNLEVDFFGGEPLMNFEVVKQLVEYGRELEKQYNKTFRFTLTTNGVLLDDEKIDYINENMYNVVLSLDGRKEVNDKMRPTPNKKSSYDIIVPKFLDLINKRQGKSYYLRGTYTKNNLDFSEDVFHMADLGVHEISVEPVVSDPKESYALGEDDLETLFQQYELLAKGMIKRRKEGKGFNFFHYMIDLSQGPCVYKRLTGCGAGSEYFAITPSGDIYPCHQFVGLPEFKLGDVDTGVVKKELVEEFSKTNVLSKPECRECWAKFYCSGGCSANSYHFNGTINGTYPVGCELQKKRTECAIYLKADEMLEDNEEIE